MRKSTHTPEYIALCEELRSVREKAGYSQRELALRLDAPHSWVAKVETGERRIDLVEFCWFIVACGADPQESFARVIPKARGRRATAGGRSK